VTAIEIYRGLILQIAPFLKGRGFSKRSDSFYFEKDGNRGLIDFQRSKKSTPDEVIFTINVGVCSGRLVEFFMPDAVGQRPAIEDCHWRERVGFLLPEKSDKWWRIYASDSLEDWVSEIQSSLEQVVVPEVESHILDENLCAAWMSGKSPGLTEIQRLINLSVLLKKRGDEDSLINVVQEMKKLSEGTATESMVRVHLRHLESLNGVG
jgi:hypothetical protein